MSNASSDNAIPSELVEILRCPVTGGRLRLEGQSLVSEIGGLRYPIREGIPVMLPEEAGLPEGLGSLDEFRAKFGRRA